MWERENSKMTSRFLCWATKIMELSSAEAVGKSGFRGELAIPEVQLCSC